MTTETGPEVEPEPAASRPERRTGTRIARALWLPVIVAFLVALYYFAGAWWIEEIEADPDFGASIEVPQDGSHAVALAAGLVDREVNLHYWTANDPAILPGSLLDNMPSFQAGMVSALARFTVELRDQMARVRGSSQSDPDLEAAGGRLSYPGNVWIFEWSRTPVQPSSESQYRRAVEDLQRYNQRLSQGQATFERRADNLQALLDRIAADLGGSSAALTRKIEGDATYFLDFTADNDFYNTKGRLYAYYIVLRGLGLDMEATIAERGVRNLWDEMMRSLREGAVLQPWVVMNAPLDSLTNPNHLAAQGFLLLRARTQLRELTSVLER
jgi:hypothetical protein